MWRRRWRLVIGVATLACCGGLAVGKEAEHVDSGWAVSTRSVISPNTKHADPKQQITLHHLLHQTQVPLLPNTTNTQAVAPTADHDQSAAATLGSLRFAVRPDGVDGWRPVGQSVIQWHEQLPSNNGTPQLNTPAKTENAANSAAIENAHIQNENEHEIDCGDRGDQETDRPATELKWSSTNDFPPAGESEAGQLPSNDSTDPALDNPVDSTDEAVEPLVEQPAELHVDESSTEDADQPEETEADSNAKSDLRADRETYDDDSTVAPVKKPTPPPPLTKQLVALRSRVRSVLKGYYRRQLNSRDNDPWEVMHGMLAYGVHSRIRQGGPRGTPVTSVGWLCYNKPCKNMTLMYVNPKGELRAKYGVGLQGHLGQLLAMLAQCRVSDEYPIRIGKREFTIANLIEAEKKTCYPKSELTFKLLAFQYYLDLNDTWLNDQGLEWDFPRVIREELAQPIRGAACGGTHRLSSLSLTVKARQRRGEPLDGEYKRAYDFVQKYHRYAFSLQNRDGSLSTEWFRGRGDDSDINRRIKTTGHILEWLCYSLSDEELRQPKTIAAVSYLANLMYKEYDNEWEVGPMSHATHALLLYDERVFQPFDGENYTATYKPKPRTSANTGRRSGAQTNRR
jgi:hypothetical protein